MRTVATKIYTYRELSDDAKALAVSKYNESAEYSWAMEFYETGEMYG